MKFRARTITILGRTTTTWPAFRPNVDRRAVTNPWASSSAARSSTAISRRARTSQPTPSTTLPALRPNIDPNIPAHEEWHSDRGRCHLRYDLRPVFLRSSLCEGKGRAHARQQRRRRMRLSSLLATHKPIEMESYEVGDDLPRSRRRSGGRQKMGSGRACTKGASGIASKRWRE